MSLYIICSNKNKDLIQYLVDNEYVRPCPYTVSFIDACMLGLEFNVMINHVGIEVCNHILTYLEQEQEFEICKLLHQSIMDYNGLVPCCG